MQMPPSAVVPFCGVAFYQISYQVAEEKVIIPGTASARTQNSS